MHTIYEFHNREQVCSTLEVTDKQFNKLLPIGSAFFKRPTWRGKQIKYDKAGLSLYQFYVFVINKLSHVQMVSPATCSC